MWKKGILWPVELIRVCEGSWEPTWCHVSGSPPKNAAGAFLHFRNCFNNENYATETVTCGFFHGLEWQKHMHPVACVEVEGFESSSDTLYSAHAFMNLTYEGNLFFYFFNRSILNIYFNSFAALLCSQRCEHCIARPWENLSGIYAPSLLTIQ